jgi:hypothetical protein
LDVAVQAIRGIPREHIPLIRILAALKTREPAYWGMFESAMHTLLDPELAHVVRVPTKLLKTAQGRAQISDDILKIMRDCIDLAVELQRQEAARAAATPPAAPAQPTRV